MFKERILEQTNPSFWQWILIGEFIGTTSLGNGVGPSFLYPSAL
jgi:hypothetical protein